MEIICTVLHICNTPPVLVYNITWIQNCSFVMFCTRYWKTNTKKESKLKRENDKLVRVWQFNLERRARPTCTQPDLLSDLIYCAVFTNIFLSPFMFSLIFYFNVNRSSHTEPARRRSRCLIRFCIYSSVVPPRGVGWESVCRVLWFPRFSSTQILIFLRQVTKQRWRLFPECFAASWEKSPGDFLRWCVCFFVFCPLVQSLIYLYFS